MVTYKSTEVLIKDSHLQAEQGQENLMNTVEELRLQKIELEKTIAELKLKFDQAEKRSAELREAEEKKHAEEVQFLKKTNMQLKVKIETYSISYHTQLLFPKDSHQVKFY